MAKLQADLKEFIALLNSHNIEYIVVGGHAVAFHGHPRFTGDIDFFVRTTSENAQRLHRVLEAFGFGGIGIAEGDLIERGRVISLGQPRRGGRGEKKTPRSPRLRVKPVPSPVSPSLTIRRATSAGADSPSRREQGFLSIDTFRGQRR
ncbi:MAG TPA: hypothetical protein VGQ65_20175 [Thermoanaerobaculia bacterium]|nr:hypothetical protein [Thermoanaerobaculia bacterium]